MLEYLGPVKGTPQDVYRHDTECVKICDLLLAECSYPAIGLGFEICLALSLGKQVLAVARPDAKVSRMIIGITHPNYTFSRYDSFEGVISMVNGKVKLNE